MHNLQEPETLSGLAARIREGRIDAFPGRYWVTAEIGELNQNRNGNCYLELIEKGDDAVMIRARIRAVILAYSFRLIKPYFESVTGRSLEPGLKILVEATVDFHAVYGLSLNIRDINPAFTVGDLALARLAVIRRLTEEGVLDMNRSLPLPPVIQRIAVISSETAAGYGDFCKQLNQNPWGYAFDYRLFPAIMQGVESQASILQALDVVHQEGSRFDAVVIVRGGGSQSDLQSFNQYELAFHIAQFPLPVLTGIGHDRDETVADLVACRSLKTPTAVAEFILGESLQFETRMQTMAYAALRSGRDKLQFRKQQLDQTSQSLMNGLQRIFLLRQSRLDGIEKQLPLLLQQCIRTEIHRLESCASRNHLLDPMRTLERGYTLTRFRGKTVQHAEALQPGDQIVTYFSDGSVQSRTEIVRTGDSPSMS